MRFTKMFFTVLAAIIFVAMPTVSAANIDFDKNIIQAKGVGLRPKSGDGGNIFSQTHARQAAIMVALRSLTEMIHGVDFEMDSPNSDSVDIVLAPAFTTRVDAETVKLVAKYAKLVDEKIFSDGYEVTLELSLAEITSKEKVTLILPEPVAEN